MFDKLMSWFGAAVTVQEHQNVSKYPESLIMLNNGIRRERSCEHQLSPKPEDFARQSQSGFFRLPPELRFQIYQLAFSGNHFLILKTTRFQRNLRARLGHRRTELAKFRSPSAAACEPESPYSTYPGWVRAHDEFLTYRGWVHDEYVDGGQLSWALTCRAAHADSIEMLYAYNHFEFDPLVSARDFYRRVPLVQFQAITSLSLMRRIIEPKQHREWMADLEFIQKKMRLRFLQLIVECDLKSEILEFLGLCDILAVTISNIDVDVRHGVFEPLNRRYQQGLSRSLTSYREKTNRVYWDGSKRHDGQILQRVCRPSAKRLPYKATPEAAVVDEFAKSLPTCSLKG